MPEEPAETQQEEEQERTAKAQPNLMSLLVRIPLFNDFVPKECQAVLAVCRQASFADGATIYEAGSPGNQMLILLKGSVKIQLGDGTEITQVEAVDTVGEMEITTSMARVANVVADGEVAGLTLSKGGLEGLFLQDPFLGIKLLRNLMGNVAKKLMDTDWLLAARISGSSSKAGSSPTQDPKAGT